MHIAFDFDGTLIDSMPALRKAAVDLIVETYEKPYVLADTWYMSTIGRSFKEQIDFLFRGDELNEFVAYKFRKEHQEIYRTAALHFGVVESILELERQHMHYCIVSSSPERLIAETLNRVLPEFNGSVYGSSSGSKRTILDHVKPEYFVGDTVYDCVLAQKRNIKFVGVTHTLPLEDVKRLGAPVTDSIPEAIDLILTDMVSPKNGSQELGGSL